jgi:hypothetical protein
MAIAMHVVAVNNILVAFIIMYFYWFDSCRQSYRLCKKQPRKILYKSLQNDFAVDSQWFRISMKKSTKVYNAKVLLPFGRTSLFRLRLCGIFSSTFFP